MDYSRVNSFLESFISDDEGKLNDIYLDARARGIPVIRKNTKELLKLLILMSGPEKILEVGAAVGYSALYMDSVSKGSGISPKIVTIELEEERADEAEENFRKVLGIETKNIRGTMEESFASGKDALGNYGSTSDDKLNNNITLLRGDAYEVMKKMDVQNYGTFDMIFIDAAKAQYKNYMEEAIRLSHKGTIIITDNILLDGEIIESHFLVEKRDRTVHDKMREFLKNIKNDERLSTVLLSVGDGMSVSIVN
ncbi:O-methyltransferase [Eubacterium ruminantium]|uniref:O-methyltransferase n=1 Tax=Eubacterium ruminantium TaxID=42322 RepID=UPI00247AECF4|nr:class I SAM-dependent methyltransferase [Eubacterium ruminantium]